MVIPDKIHLKVFLFLTSTEIYWINDDVRTDMLSVYSCSRNRHASDRRLGFPIYLDSPSVISIVLMTSRDVTKAKDGGFPVVDAKS